MTFSTIAGNRVVWALHGETPDDTTLAVGSAEVKLEDQQARTLGEYLLKMGEPDAGAAAAGAAIAEAVLAAKVARTREIIEYITNELGSDLSPDGVAVYIDDEFAQRYPDEVAYVAAKAAV